MRITAIAGLFACVAIFAASSSTVRAEELTLLNTNQPEAISALEILEEDAKKPEPKSQPKVHAAGPGESLSTIAKQHGTTWIRLFNKNEQIAHPDVLKIGDKVTIPLIDEQLKERPLPEPPVMQQAVPQASKRPANAAVQKQKPARTVTAARAGNLYTPGYCTWYAKNMRPDLPNNLGNANTWAYRAAAQGIATGRVPRAGAIGQQGMHVVYVQRVNSNGTVTISEMNFRGLYVISTRTVAASNFVYIY